MPHPIPPAPPPDIAAPGELQRLYGDRWTIELEHTLGVWSAVRKSPDGHHVRCIIERSAAELLEKLRVADVVEP